MTGNRFSGEFGPLPEADTAAYDQAIEIYRALLALLGARAERETDPDAAAQLRAAAGRYAGEQHQLRVTDRAAVARVIRDYPALARQLRDALSE